MLYPWHRISLLFLSGCTLLTAVTQSAPSDHSPYSDGVEPLMHQPALAKRDGFDVSTLKVQVSEITGRSQLTVAGTARQIQLASVGATAMTVDQWTVWVNGYTAKFSSGSMDVQVLLQDRFIAPVAAVVVIAFIFLLLVPIVALCFCCCRCGNKCGGRQPDKKGYSTKAIAGLLTFFTCVCAINVFAAALVMVYSQDLTFSVTALGNGASALLTDTDAFAGALLTGFSASPAIIKSTLNQMVGQLANIDFTKGLNLTYDPVVYGLRRELTAMQADVVALKASLNVTDALIKSAKVKSNLIPPQLRSIGASIDQMKTVTIDGTVYPVSGFPDTSALNNPSLPDLSSTPNIPAYISQLNTIPDLTQTSEDAVSMYLNVTSQIGPMLNNTIRTSIPDTSALTSGLIATMNQTFGGLQVMLRDYNSEINNNYMPTVKTYNGYRNDAFLVEMGVIMFFTVLALFGMLIRKHKLMSCLPACAILLGVLVWLQFLIFYFIALPLNVVCLSKDVVVNNDYQVMTNVLLNPQAVLDSCREDINLFNGRINSNNQTATSVLSSMISAIMNVESLLSGSSTSQLVQIPNPASALSTVTLPAIDTSAMTVSSTMPFNLQQIRTDMTENVNGLTPSSFNTDKGNDVTMRSQLNSFNALAISIKPSHQPWDALYIVTTYIKTGTSFQGQDITGNPSATSQNQQLETAYSTNVYPRVNFIYQANVTISQLKANSTAISTSINSLDTTLVSPLKTELDWLNSNVTLVQTQYSSLTTHFNNAQALSSQMTAATTAFLAWMFAAVNVVLLGGTTLLVNNLIANDPSVGFGSCRALAEDGVYLIEAICTASMNSLAGLWFGFLLMGVFLLLAFICGMKAKKRVEYLERRASGAVDGKGEKGGKDGEAGRGSRNMVSKSAAYEQDV